jgi:head-tail adaptor
MQAGRQRHRVVLEERADVQDSVGDYEVAYIELAEVWASIIPVSGRERIAGAQVASEHDTRIVIRFRRGLDSTIRIRHVVVHESPAIEELYDVQAILPDATGRRWLTFLCTKRVAEGWRRGE